MPTIDNWRSTLMRAAINCPHDIEAESVVLEQSAKQSDGNALAQLADRLGEAVKPLLDERDRLAAEAQHAADVAEAYKAQAESLAAEVEAMRGAISKACAGYPADSIAVPTCVQILREALGAAMKGKP